MGGREHKHPRDGRKARDMKRIMFREDFETNANRGSRSTFEKVFFLRLVQSVRYKRIFLALASLIGPVQENISCLGQSSRSGTREYFLPWLQSSRSSTRENFLPWLVQLVWYKRIFLALASLVGLVQENISCLGQSSRSRTREYFLPWLVQSFRYQRIFSLQAETTVSFSQLHRQHGRSVNLSLNISSMVHNHCCSLFLAKVRQLFKERWQFRYRITVFA